MTGDSARPTSDATPTRAALDGPTDAVTALRELLTVPCIAERVATLQAKYAYLLDAPVASGHPTDTCPACQIERDAR